MVGAFAYCAKGRRIHPLVISHSSQCSTTGVTKTVVRAILFVNIKDPLLPIGTCSPCIVGSGFPLSSLNGPLPYVSRHITVNKMCRVRH